MGQVRSGEELERINKIRAICDKVIYMNVQGVNPYRDKDTDWTFRTRRISNLQRSLAYSVARHEVLFIERRFSKAGGAVTGIACCDAGMSLNPAYAATMVDNPKFVLNTDPSPRVSKACSFSRAIRLACLRHFGNVVAYWALYPRYTRAKPRLDHPEPLVVLRDVLELLKPKLVLTNDEDLCAMFQRAHEHIPCCTVLGTTVEELDSGLQPVAEQYAPLFSLPGETHG